MNNNTLLPFYTPQNGLPLLFLPKSGQIWSRRTGSLQGNAPPKKLSDPDNWQ